MAPQIDDTTVALLNRLLVGRSPFDHSRDPQGEFREGITRVDLPAADDAEYFFRLAFHETGERYISAHLIERPNAANYFWYRPFELAEFRGSGADLAAEFCKEMELVLTHATRIVQRKGWLFWRFRCEYRNGQKWTNISSQMAFRGGRFSPPHIDGTMRIYCSAAIAPA
jgi:hypothetical protein